jgi:hypothetical protein
MHLKYLHYFGNESSESLLEAYGIISKDQQSVDLLRPKQCPNCNEPNKPDSRFCAKCRMVLTYDAYNETLEGQKEKEDQLNMVQSQLNSMQSQIYASAYHQSHQISFHMIYKCNTEKDLVQSNSVTNCSTDLFLSSLFILIQHYTII